MVARFAGRTSIITGAASGIGQAAVIRLVSEGASVLAVDLNEAGLSQTIAQAADAAGHGGRATSRVANVSKEAEVKSVVADFVAKVGRLDCMINMAGILRTSHTVETTLEQFMEVINVNLVSTFLFCREALPHLEKVQGCIVNAASTSTFFGHPYMTAYAASKGAIGSMTRTLAWEYIKRGVRVNAVAPGGISTGMTKYVQDNPLNGMDPVLFSHLIRPDGVFGVPANIAAVIAMLASNDGAFMTGEIVRVDGGTHS